MLGVDYCRVYFTIPPRASQAGHTAAEPGQNPGYAAASVALNPGVIQSTSHAMPSLSAASSLQRLPPLEYQLHNVQEAAQRTNTLLSSTCEFLTAHT